MLEIIQDVEIKQKLENSFETLNKVECRNQIINGKQTLTCVA